MYILYKRPKFYRRIVIIMCYLIKDNIKIIQKKIYSKDFRHKYLITILLNNGEIISKSKIEITQK